SSPANALSMYTHPSQASSHRQRQDLEYHLQFDRVPFFRSPPLSRCSHNGLAELQLSLKAFYHHPPQEWSSFTCILSIIVSYLFYVNSHVHARNQKEIKKKEEIQLSYRFLARK